MAREDRPKIIVEELPGGGTRWRRSEEPASPPAPSESEDTFKHRIGSGHNLIRLFELFVAAWENHCEKRKGGGLLIPDQESASELHGLSLELQHRLSRELMRIPQRKGGGIYYDDLGGEDRQILHACVVMSKALTSLKLERTPFIAGTVLSNDALKAFHRAVRILANWFSAAEDSPSAGDAQQGTGSASAAMSGKEGLPPATLGEALDWLIRLPALAKSLGWEGAGWLRDLERNAGTPAWKAERCRPFFRVGALLAAARRIAPDKYGTAKPDSVPISPYLLQHMKPPSFKPKWAAKATVRPPES